MKYFLSLISGFLLVMSSFSAAAFTPSVQLSNEDVTYYSTAIDTVLDAYVARHTESSLWYKFPIIRDRITNALARTNLPNEVIYILEYLDWYIVTWMGQNPKTTTTNTTSTSTTATNSSSINISQYEEGDKQIAVGVISGPVIKFEIVADLEDIEVKEYSLKSNISNLENYIEKIYVYNEDGELLDSDRPSGNMAEFDTSFLLEKGENELYVAIKPLNLENNTANMYFTLMIDETEGVSSGNDIGPISIVNTEDEIQLVEVSAGEVSLHASYHGYYVDSKLYNQATADLAIVSMDVGASDDIDLKTMEITLNDNTVAEDIHTTLTVQRIDSLSNEVNIDNINGNQVTFDLTQFGSKANVKAGTTAVFLISGTPILDSTVSEMVEIEINPSQTSNGVFTYSREGSSQIVGTSTNGYVGDSQIAD